MTTYKDINGNKRDVWLVKDMQERKSDATRKHEQTIIDHNASQRMAWNEFVALATAHLPKDVMFHYTNGTLTRCRVYLPNDFMEMGELMMEEHIDNDGKQERFYHVTSHHITNRRFCPYNSPWEYRTRSTKSVDKAIKNARTALRPNTLADVARVACEKVKDCVSNMKHDAERDFRTATAKLGFSGLYSHEKLPPILDDIIRQTDMGLVRLSDESDKLLSDFNRYRRIAKNADSYEYATLCWVHTNHAGDQVVETHDLRVSQGSVVEDNGKGLTAYNKDYCARSKQTYCNNVPEDVQNKVSVLSILDNNQYVEEVGYKYSDSVYFIFKDQ